MKNQIKSAFVITGATGSIGRELAIALAKTKKPIVLACRNQEKAEKLRQFIIENCGNKQIYSFPLSLDEPKSIMGLVESMKANNISIHALINNAGVKVPTYTLTSDGREMTFSVNYLGLLMLTSALIPLIADH